MPVRDDYEYVRIAGIATTQVVGVACKLIRIVINTTGGSVTNIYNSTSSAIGTANLVGVIKASVAEGDYEYGIKLATGLTIATVGAASDLTVVYATA